MTSTQTAAAAVSEEELFAFKSRIMGEVTLPGDPRYDEARMAWNLTFDQRPAMIVEAAGAADVAEAVRFARGSGLGLATQATGHGPIGLPDGGLLLLTGRMKEMRIDPEARTAWLSAGLKWGEVLEKTQQYGLAPLLGSSPDVGVVGYTLGGGFGWLGRKYGLSTDSVTTFEVVTADGALLCASAQENPELYWALRGGGGSFGIVTAMEIRLYPVDTVYGGNLIYPAVQAKEVMQRYREWTRTAPDELTSSVVLMNFPPFPAIPEFLRAKSFVMVRGCYTGPVEEGEDLLKSWRDWQSPLLDDFKVMPFSQVATISSDPVDPVPAESSGGWMNGLSDEAIDAIIAHTLPAGGPPNLMFTEVRHFGGAIRRVDPAAAAFSHRDAEMLMFCVGGAPTPADVARVRQAIANMKQAMQSAMTGGVYMNFVHGEEARQRTKDGYSPETYRRLQELKASLDPENIFRFGYDFSRAS